MIRFQYSILCSLCILSTSLVAAEPEQGDVIKLPLGKRTSLEVVYIPAGKFMMGSTAEEKAWATGIEGGAQPGTDREQFEGEPREVSVTEGFWMGRTEVTRGQFSRFCEETGYVTDAEKPNGWTQVFNHDWDRYNYTDKVIHPWEKLSLIHI